MSRINSNGENVNIGDKISFFTEGKTMNGIVTKKHKTSLTYRDIHDPAYKNKTTKNNLLYSRIIVMNGSN